MRTAKLRSVKKEIRVLGLTVISSCEGAYLQGIGVVYRGWRWLDGVMSIITQDPDVTDKLVEMVNLSPHHAQLRVLLLHKDLIEKGAIFNPYTISAGTSRPVITLFKDPSDQVLNRAEHNIPINSFILEKDNEHITAMSIGLLNQEATEVLKMSTRDGLMPEVLKVARLIAASIVEATQQNI
jgi:endonuclease V-like protein UPF0215 family